MKSKVAILRTTPKTVVNDYGKLLDLADYRKHLPQDKETIFKLNLSWSLYYPACSTQPWQLEGTLKKFLADGYKHIYPVENETVVTNVWKGATGNKWMDILERYGQQFEALTEVEWVPYKPKGELLALHEVFPEEHCIPKMFMGKNVVHFPTVKTHGHTQMTGAMKNAFGGLINKNRHHCHKKIHEVLVDLLTIQKEIHPGIFAVMDGTVCGDGAGPRTMIPVQKDLILAASDQVAIDALSAKLMGYDPLKIPFIKMAHDRGLGCGDVDQLDIVGLPKKEVLKMNFHFSTGKSPVIFFDQLFRKHVQVVERALFHTGLFAACVFGSAFYHDYLWYPTIGKMNINAFNKTPWGQLWKTYK